MGETFELLGARWHVEAALELTEGRPTVEVPVSAAATLLGLIRYDTEHAKTADLSRPLLLAPVTIDGEKSYLVIDGWHRLARAVADGVETLPGRLLTADEQRRVRLCEGLWAA